MAVSAWLWRAGLRRLQHSRLQPCARSIRLHGLRLPHERCASGEQAQAESSRSTATGGAHAVRCKHRLHRDANAA